MSRVVLILLLEFRAHAVGHARAGLEQIHQGEADDQRDQGRADVDPNRLATDAGELLQIRQRRDAGDERRQHQRHGDEQQEAKEDGAKRRDPIGGELTPAGRGRDDAVHQT